MNGKIFWAAADAAPDNHAIKRVFGFLFRDGRVGVAHVAWHAWQAGWHHAGKRPKETFGRLIWRGLDGEVERYFCGPGLPAESYEALRAEAVRLGAKVIDERPPREDQADQSEGFGRDGFAITHPTMHVSNQARKETAMPRVKVEGLTEAGRAIWTALQGHASRETAMSGKELAAACNLAATNIPYHLKRNAEYFPGKVLSAHSRGYWIELGRTSARPPAVAAPAKADPAGAEHPGDLAEFDDIVQKMHGCSVEVDISGRKFIREVPVARAREVLRLIVGD